MDKTVKASSDSIDAHHKGCYGFEFSVPISLYRLGNNFRIDGKILGWDAEIETRHIDLQGLRIPIVGARLQSDSGLRHNNDRFGLHGCTDVIIKLRCSFVELVEAGLLKFLKFSDKEGQKVIVMPGEADIFCAHLFNQIIDSYCLTFESYHLNRIRAADIFGMRCMQYEPEHQDFGILFGSQHGKFEIGRNSGISELDRKRFCAELSDSPLPLYKECILISLRELNVGDLRNAMMHVGLSFEVFVYSLLSENQERIKASFDPSMSIKTMCERRSLLPSLIGGSLNNESCHDKNTHRYRRILALRNAVMHKGELSYEYRDSGGLQVCEIVNSEQARNHVILLQELQGYLRSAVANAE